MDKKLQIVDYLYAEATSEAELRALLADEALREEYEALSAAKFEMDRRPRVRPEASVIDRILASAAERPPAAAPHRWWRPDRAARSGRAARGPSLRIVAAAAVVVFTVSLGLWRFQLPAETQPSLSQRAEAPAALAPNRQAYEHDARASKALADQAVADADLQEAAPPSKTSPSDAALADARVANAPANEAQAAGLQARRTQPALRQQAKAEAEAAQAPAAPPTQAFAIQALESGAASDDALGAAADGLVGGLAGVRAQVVPSWDDSDDLQRLYRRIQALQQGNNALNWDEAAVPLEQLPGAGLQAPRGAAGVQPASSRQQPRRNNR